MSRFHTPRAVLDAPLEPAPAAAILDFSPPCSSWMQRVGFAAFGILTLSPYANEFAIRWFHTKAYISTVSWVLVPVLFVLSGNLLRGFQDLTGRLWLGFLVWITLAVPFSVWKGGSVALLLAYVPHAWMQLLYYAAFLISIQYCRRWMFVLIASNFLLLLNCFLFGATLQGRFEIPESMFSTNANDLALQLLIAITQFLFLLYQREVWKNILGGAAIVVALAYMLKTGSRGAFLAVFILACVNMAFAKNRARLATIGIPIAAVALLLVPSSVFHRLTLIGPQFETGRVADSRTNPPWLRRRKDWLCCGRAWCMR